MSELPLDEEAVQDSDAFPPVSCAPALAHPIGPLRHLSGRLLPGTVLRLDDPAAAVAAGSAHSQGPARIPRFYRSQGAPPSGPGQDLSAARPGFRSPAGKRVGGSGRVIMAHPTEECAGLNNEGLPQNLWVKLEVVADSGLRFLRHGRANEGV